MNQSEESCDCMIFRKAVLIIHGFAGGVYDQESLQYKLNPNWKLDVYNFTLPGHECNLTRDVKYEEWIKSVDDHIEYLINQGYHSIYVVGHSMGGVLATHAAIKYKEIKKVVLVAPAFQYLDAENKILNKVDAIVKNGVNIVKAYKAKEIISRILKVSVPLLFEFAKLVDSSQDLPQELNKPVLLVQGTSDDIVPQTSSEFVYDSAKGPKWLIYLDGISHEVFNSEKADIVNDEVEKFLVKRRYNAESIRRW